MGQLTLGMIRTLLSFCDIKSKESNATEAEERFETKNGKFTRPMSVYKNHLRLVTNKGEHGL